MVDGIGCAHKLGKKNRQIPVVKNGPLNITSPTLKSHVKTNENTGLGSKEPIAAEKYFRPSSDVIHTTDDLIQTKTLSIPHTKTC